MVDEIFTQDAMFYKYIDKMRQKISDGQMAPEEIEDIFLEVLDFIWNHLTDEDRQRLNQLNPLD